MRIRTGFTAKGLLIPDDGVPIPFQYNPTEIDDQKSNLYASKTIPGQAHPVKQFIAGGERKISFDMTVSRSIPYTNTHVPGIAEAYVASVRDLMYPVVKDGKLIAGPALFLMVFGAYFLWGRFESINVKRKEFDSMLNLELATLSCSFFEVPIYKASKTRLNYIGRWI